MKRLKVVVGFETSGVLSSAIRNRGHFVSSFDILPSDINCKFHDQVSFYDFDFSYYDCAILHPPCTYLCSSGIHWNNKIENREIKTKQSLDLFKNCLNLDIKFLAIENPVGIASSLKKPDQIIQPYEYQENASKKTCLWLKGFPKLISSCCVLPERYTIDGLPRWRNQSDSGADKTPRSKDRWKIRSKTYQGIAKAIAEQWFPLCPYS